jgi:hypothetical protein
MAEVADRVVVHWSLPRVASANEAAKMRSDFGTDRPLITSGAVVVLAT